MAQDLSERPGDLEPASLVLHDQGSTSASIQGVAYSAHVGLEGCQGVGVMVVHNAVAAGLAYTSQVAQQLDWVQGEIGDGPALLAIRQLQVFNVPDLSGLGPWPEFGRVARAVGIKSGLFVPIIEGGRALGAMSFYSKDEDAFTGQEQVALSFSAEAARAMPGGP